MEKESARPDFWSDQAEARGIMRQLAEQKRVVEKWRSLERRVVEITELLAMAVEEEDVSLEGEIRSEIEELGRRLD